MKRAASALLLALALAAMAGAHRLDEYLQLTAISVGRERVDARMFLTPGVAVSPRVTALIDANGDGLLSEKEKTAYAARVLKGLSLTVDGVTRNFHVVATHFPSVSAMRQGVGEIEIDLDAPVPGGAGDHRLVFENRHERSIAAYLVECFVPDDPSLRITAQKRSREQERYEVSYSQTGKRRAPLTRSSWLYAPNRSPTIASLFAQSASARCGSSA